MRTKSILIISILIFIIISNVFSQNEFNNTIRAQYIYDLSKYFQWPEDYEKEKFEIAIISDSVLFNELVKLTNGKLKNEKEYNITLITKVSDIQAYHIIYNNKKTGFSLDTINYFLKDNPTLLISENYPFHKTMLNFIVVDGRCRFEMLEEKIAEKGITYPRLLSAQAVQTKANWEELYNKTEVLLEKEKEVVKTQNIQIQEQLVQIDEQHKRIDSQKVEIKKQTTHIEIQKQEIKQQQKELGVLASEIKVKQSEIDKSIVVLNKQKEEIESQRESITTQKKTLKQQTENIESQEKKLVEQESRLNNLLAQLKLQRVILILSIVLLGVFIFLGYFIYRAYRIKKMSNIVLKAKNKEILAQKEEIETQRDEIEIQRDTLAKQKQEITDSIHYASRIQAAVLPPQEFINKILPHNYFILYKPRDIVSGDFFWISQKENKTVITVADCTGHGVPGAFMSMLGISFLNEIVNANNVLDANMILNELRDHVIKALHQTGESGENKDGMDIALCVIDFDRKKLQFSGAYNPLYLIRNKELLHFKADKMPIGIYFKGDQSFTNQEIEFQKGDTIYVFSDGYVDQFGGEKNSKFKSKQFKELLVNIQIKSMTEQKEILDQTIEKWKGENEQIDDILVMGIKL